ncbi:RNA polymerase II mediator complex subunit [Tulasnella sp. 418]|nr:RNA polymerase II mediator complex subunit [Tulasnella sp. 418]
MISTALSFKMSGSNATQKDARAEPPATIRPPKWRAPWHKTADLGYPDFLPPRPGQEEDSMAEAYVKTGFVGKPIVATDSFTVHDMIHDTWEKNGQDVLNQLGNLMTEVFARRNGMANGIGPSTPKLPERRTLPPQKTAAWITDLANPNVPLSNLAKVIPNGPKDNALLDMLEANHVAIPRAVWYVRVVGAADTQYSNKAGNSAMTQYGINWTNVVTTHLKKQLSDIVLPRGIAGQSSAIKSTFKSILSDPESRDRWVNRFSYTLALIREFYAEGLIDHSLFLFWLSQQVGQSNIAQLGFVTKLADEYLEGILQHRGFLRPFILGCVEKLMEVGRITQEQDALLPTLTTSLASLLQRAFVAFPDAFIYPRLWKSTDNVRLLNALFVTEATNAVPHLNRNDTRVQDLLLTLKEHFDVVELRNEAILFNVLPERSTVSMRITMADIQLLNSISPNTEIPSIGFFEQNCEDATDPSTTSFQTKLDVLFTWSVTASQYGDHRPFAAASILRTWRDEAKLRATRRKTARPDAAIQDRLFQWLDTSIVARNHRANMAAVSRLYGELARRNLFSYERFIYRLMARGEAGTGNVGETGRSHLMTILAYLPLSSPSLINERRAALYGLPAKASGEEAEDRAMRRRVKSALPAIFGSTPESMDASVDIHEILSTLEEATCFAQGQLIMHWLLPATLKHIEKMSLDHGVNEPRLNQATYSTVVEMMRCTKLYAAILELNSQLLRDTQSAAEVMYVVWTLRRHADVWASMDALQDIAQLLYATHQRLQMSQLHLRPLVDLLNAAPYRRYLTAADRDKIASDMDSFAQTLHPDDHSQAEIPSVLPTVLQLPHIQDPHAAQNLASNLWYDYHDNPNWGAVVWENVMYGISQVAATAGDDDTLKHQSIDCYLMLLKELDRYLPSGDDLDKQVHRWFTEGGRQRFADLEPVSWDLVTPWLIGTTLHGIISGATLLSGIVYFAWERAASLSLPSTFTEAFLEAANTLARQLLITDIYRPSESDTLFNSFSISDIQMLQAQRQQVLSGSDVTLLFKALPNLVSLEVNNLLEERIRKASTELRVELSQHVQFRTTAFRHIGALRDAFLSSSSSQSEMMELRIAEALRLIIHSEEHADGDSAGDWESLFAGMNAWGFSRSSIELQLTLKHMSSGMDHEDTKAKAEKDLQRFMTGFFGRTLDMEETDLLADVLYGISGRVATKFLNVGLERLATHLTNLPSPLTVPSIRSFLHDSGEILRLLAAVIVPKAGDERPCPPLEQDAVDVFFPALSKAIVDAGIVAAPSRKDTAPSPLVTDSSFHEYLVLLCRLLQFALRFDGLWTTKAKGVAEDTVAAMVRLTVAMGGGVLETRVLEAKSVDDSSSDSEDDSGPYREGDEGGSMSAAVSPTETSARASSVSRRTAEREIIDVDAISGPETSIRGQKRKANAGTAAAGASDDDIEIIEQPTSAIRGKRGRGRPPGSRGKQKRKS